MANQFTSSELSQNIGEVLEAARKNPVTITHYKRPQFVILSHEKFEQMKTAGNPRKVGTWDDLSDGEMNELETALENYIKE